MAKRTLMIDDLRINPDDLAGFADQLRAPPHSVELEWPVPELKLGDDISIRPDWNDGPMVRILIPI